MKYYYEFLRRYDEIRDDLVKRRKCCYSDVIDEAWKLAEIEFGIAESTDETE